MEKLTFPIDYLDLSSISLAELVAFDGSKTKRLSNLSKINVFVGTNNSGKSRLLRYIANLDNTTYGISFNHFDLDEAVDLAFRTVERLLNEHSSATEITATSDKPIFSNVQKIKKDGLLVTSTFSQSSVDGERWKCLQEILEIACGKIERVNLQRGNSRSSQENTDHLLNILRRTTDYPNFDEVGQLVSKIENALKDSRLQLKKVYIPILRGLRHPSKSQRITDKSNEDLYSQRTVSDHFQDASQNNNLSKSLSIHSGLQMFDQVKALLLGDHSDRSKISQFEEFLSRHFFDGESVEIVPYINDDVLYVKLGREDDRPIYDLGDGIQAIINLTFPLFLADNSSNLVFIEEPEINLHPGMQRKLIQTLATEFPDHQFFITTHSNHILDLSTYEIPLTVFKCHKKETERGINYFCHNIARADRSILDDLGVNNSSLYLANCTVWVEGITDRRYLHHYLKLYESSSDQIQKFKLDIDYAFVEYSGSNISHWSFLDSDESEDGISEDAIFRNILIIADQDSKTGWKNERHLRLKEVFGDYYKVLPVKEIENLLSPSILKVVIESYEGRSLENLVLKRNEYRTKYLGSYIGEQLSDKSRKGAYAAKSGTVSDKTNFCQKALEALTNFEQLTHEAQNLTKEIHNFISQHKT